MMKKFQLGDVIRTDPKMNKSHASAMGLNTECNYTVSNIWNLKDYQMICVVGLDGTFLADFFVLYEENKTSSTKVASPDEIWDITVEIAGRSRR